MLSDHFYNDRESLAHIAKKRNEQVTEKERMMGCDLEDAA